MEILKKISELKKIIHNCKEKKLSVGFVPTMGALHLGHLSLVEKAKSENKVVVVSIFVNPLQFNNQSDLIKYPRTIENDIKLLDSANCDIVFVPDNNEMYPEPENTIYNFGQLDKVMEGKFRPGHFNGVAVVVNKLFEIVTPDKAYFGEKDFQQLQIIKELVKQKCLPIDIVSCPIMRENDGLAMSSRNLRLSTKDREIAPVIFNILKKSKEFIEKKSPNEIVKWIEEQISNYYQLKLEYFEIVNAQTLLPIKTWDECDEIIGCIAVFLNEIRLIDNIFYKNT